MDFKSQQEVFDFVVGALIAQGRPAVTREPTSAGARGKSTCKYRSEDGAKCAGGHVIPDEIYTKGLEGQSIRTVVMQHPALAALRQYANLLIDLQNNHDTAALCLHAKDENDTEWLRRFKDGARRTAFAYNLVPTGVNAEFVQVTYES